MTGRSTRGHGPALCEEKKKQKFRKFLNLHHPKEETGNKIKIKTFFSSHKQNHGKKQNSQNSNFQEIQKYQKTPKTPQKHNFKKFQNNPKFEKSTEAKRYNTQFPKFQKIKDFPKVQKFKNFKVRNSLQK